MAQTKLRWSSRGLASYKKSGEEMKSAGFSALRGIQDGDYGTTLTFWVSMQRGTVIQETWVETGDVVFYRAMPDLASAVEDK